MALLGWIAVEARSTAGPLLDRRSSRPGVSCNLAVDDANVPNLGAVR